MAERDPLSGFFAFEETTQGRFKPSQPLDAHARAVLLQMASHRNWKHGGSVWASANTIANETGISERTVADRFERLEAGGWLVRTGAKKGRAVVYDLAVPIEAKSAPHADYEAANSAPRAEDPLRHAQTNPELNLEEAADPELAPAGDGPDDAGSPERRLVEMRLAAERGEFPDDQSLVDALRPFPMPGLDRGVNLDALTDVEQAADFLLVLDAAINASDRLPDRYRLSAAQLLLAVRRVRQRVAFPIEAAAWDDVEFRNEYWRPVGQEALIRDRVEFVAGSIVRAMGSGEERHAVGR